MNIGIIGGSGRFGSALATGFARAGFNVFLGGREKQKVEAKAKEIIEETGSSTVFGFRKQESRRIG